MTAGLLGRPLSSCYAVCNEAETCSPHFTTYVCGSKKLLSIGILKSAKHYCRPCTAAVSAVDVTSIDTLVNPDSVVVKFVLKRQCCFGQRFFVCGGHPALGDWDLNKAVPGEWSEGDIWTATAILPRGISLPFKFVMVGKRGEVEWQAGDNPKLHTIAVAPKIEVEVQWDTSKPLVITNLEAEDPLFMSVASLSNSAALEQATTANGWATPAQAAIEPNATSQQLSQADEDGNVASAEQILRAVDDLMTDDEDEIMEALMEKTSGVTTSLLADALKLPSSGQGSEFL